MWIKTIIQRGFLYMCYKDMGVRFNIYWQKWNIILIRCHWCIITRHVHGYKLDMKETLTVRLMLQVVVQSLCFLCCAAWYDQAQRDCPLCSEHGAICYRFMQHLISCIEIRTPASYVNYWWYYTGRMYNDAAHSWNQRT